MIYKSKEKNYMPMIFRNLNNGFTLVELVVVIAIIGIIMTVVLIKKDSWNDNLALRSQAYELAMTIRQAKAYALGVVRNDNIMSGDKFSSGYGVFFDKDNPNEYVLFGDMNGNGQYEANEVIEKKRFTNGVIIYDLCGIRDIGGFGERCSLNGGNIAKITVFFVRPNPKAIVSLLNSGGNQSTNIVPPAKIFMKIPTKNMSLFVEIFDNGQISVKEGIPSS